MRVLTSWWRHGLAAVVATGWMLAAGAGPGLADSEKEVVAKEPKPGAQETVVGKEQKPEAERADAAKERKPEAVKLERERAAEGEKAEREAHARKLKERIEQLQRERRALGPEEAERAEKLEREMRAMRERLQAIVARHHLEPGRERLTHRLKEVREALHRARQAGRHDEVDRLEREFEKIIQVLRPKPAPSIPPEREEARRLRHLKQAVEHLRAGGFDELAQRLEHEAQRRLREVRPDAPAVRPPHPEHRPRPRPELHRPAPPEWEATVRRLRDEIHRLHRQMEEMRAQRAQLLEERQGNKP